MNFLEKKLYKKQAREIDLLEKRLLFMETSNSKTENSETQAVAEKIKEEDNTEQVDPKEGIPNQESAFTQKAKNVFRGFQPGEAAANVFHLHASRKGRLQTLLEKEIESHTSLAGKALANLEGKFRFIGEKAQKRMTELTLEQEILEKTIKELQEQTEKRSTHIDNLRKLRGNVSFFAVHKKIKYKAHAVGDTANALGRRMTGSMSDDDFEGKVAKTTLSAAENLLEKNKAKQAKWETRKEGEVDRDSEKITSLAGLFGTNEEDTKKLLGEFFANQNEKTTEKDKTTRDLLSSITIKSIIEKIKQKKPKEVAEILKRNGKNLAGAIKEIIKSFKTEIPAGDLKKLQLVEKIEEASKNNPNTKRLIYDILDGMSRGTKFDLMNEAKKEERKKEEKKEKTEEDKVKTIQELFTRNENPLDEGRTCNLEIEDITFGNKEKDKNFYVGKVEENAGKVTKFELWQGSPNRNRQVNFNLNTRKITILKAKKDQNLAELSASNKDSIVKKEIILEIQKFKSIRNIASLS